MLESQITSTFCSSIPRERETTNSPVSEWLLLVKALFFIKRYAMNIYSFGVVGQKAMKHTLAFHFNFLHVITNCLWTVILTLDISERFNCYKHFMTSHLTWRTLFQFNNVQIFECCSLEPTLFEMLFAGNSIRRARQEPRNVSRIANS